MIRDADSVKEERTHENNKLVSTLKDVYEKIKSFLFVRDPYDYSNKKYLDHIVGTSLASLVACGVSLDQSRSEIPNVCHVGSR